MPRLTKMLHDPKNRAFSDAIQERLEREPAEPRTPVTKTDIRKVLGDIVAVDFGPDSRPSWAPPDQQGGGANPH